MLITNSSTILRWIQPNIDITPYLKPVQTLLEWGYNIGYRIIEGWWIDTGKKDDILTVNAMILDERAIRDIRGEVLHSRIEGRVMVGEGTEIINSTIRGPTIIGEKCHIENPYIGPYTSIGDEVEIIESELEYSVIMQKAQIKGVEQLTDSLIGRHAKIIRGDTKRRTVNYPTINGGASCFIEAACPEITAFAETRSRGLLSTGS